MKTFKRAAILSGLLIYSIYGLNALNSDTTIVKDIIGEANYKKYPGIPKTMAKIYHSDKRYAISGFGEANYVQYLGPKNINESDIELYYTNLYRSGTYLAYKISDKIIFNSELQVELLHDGFREHKTEANLEVIVDFLLHPMINIRVGNYPLPLGYVNVNEEPVSFYTVNRPETERIILPTQWLDMGGMIYGYLGKKLEYSLGITKGLRAENFSEGSWISNGRFHELRLPRTAAFNGKLEFIGNDDVLLGAGAYHGDASDRYMLSNGERLKSNLSILSGYAGYTKGRWSVFGLAVIGKLTGTEQLFEINERVIGSQAYGYYGELRYNLLPTFKKQLKEYESLPVFVRYERINTHGSISREVVDMNANQFYDISDLRVISAGVNYRPKRSWVFKANYQFRTNVTVNPYLNRNEGDRVEFGLGFVF
jgi:hypothetical protein